MGRREHEGKEKREHEGKEKRDTRTPGLWGRGTKPHGKIGLRKEAHGRGGSTATERTTARTAEGWEAQRKGELRKQSVFKRAYTRGREAGTRARGQ